MVFYFCLFLLCRLMRFLWRCFLFCCKSLLCLGLSEIRGLLLCKLLLGRILILLLRLLWILLSVGALCFFCIVVFVFLLVFSNFLFFALNICRILLGLVFYFWKYILYSDLNQGITILKTILHLNLIEKFLVLLRR